MAKNSSRARCAQKGALQKAFAKASKPVFTLKNAVAEAYDMFPEFKDKVFFVDLVTNKAVHSDPEIRKQLIDFVNANERIREEINIGKFYAAHKKSSVCIMIEMGKAKMPFMALYLERDMLNVLSEDHPISETRFCVFDHEFAHATISEAYGPELRHEMVADAYMALRHFQRFGADSKTMDIMMKRRAALAFFNQDPEHFTPPALQKAIEFNEKYDIMSITPQQTARLAVHIAKESMIDEPTYKSLSRQFNRLKNVMMVVENDHPLREFSDMVLKARSPVMKKWGGVALSAFLDGYIHLKKDPKENGHRRTIALRGKYWDDVRQKVKAL